MRIVTDIRELTINTFLMSAGRVLASMSSLMIGVVLARGLTLEEFAIHRKLVLVFATAGPIFSLGLAEALFVLLANAQVSKRAAMLTNVLLLFILGSLFAVGSIYVFGPLLIDDEGSRSGIEYLFLVAVYGFFALPLQAVNPTLVVTKRVKWLLNVQLTVQILLLIMVTAAVFFEGTAKGTLSALALWAVLGFSIAFATMMRATQETGGGRPSFLEAKRQLRLAVPLGLAGLAGSLLTQLDRVMVLNFCGEKVFAVYVVGAMELPVIGLVTGSLNAVLMPNFATLFEQGKLDEIRKLWKFAMGRAALLLIPCMFGVFVFGVDLVESLYGATFRQAYEPLAIYALMLPMRCVVYGTMLLALGRSRHVTYSMVFALIINCVHN